ncbi:stage II sporulation protein D [Caldanaerobius polysaccharolyticus]|uniref:stage II sporulation protein D n=1 Tax=Caldanaerobius polysaccharolyticus TaxID=44256 RepID=UPI00047AC6F0|nr:stage II sporulation protein D [Caldanaerobius polysaccharolyticus]
MKMLIYFLVGLFAAVVFLPVSIVLSWNAISPEKPLVSGKGGAKTSYIITSDNNASGTVSSQQDYKDVNINVYVVQKGKIQGMPLEQYVKGVVAAEMPADFSIEALKAQAVASRTYAVSKMREFGGKGDGEHPGADVCTDSHHCQAWASDEELKSRWGKNYSMYKAKIDEAVDSTKGQVLVYEDKLIQPVFHAISGGRTESAADVWGKNIPYLVSVDSPYEESAPKYKSRVVMAKSEFIQRLKALRPMARVDVSNLPSQVKVLEYSQTNRVKKIRIGDQVLTGEELRNIYGLNSTNVRFAFNGNDVVMDVTGYGHGVGMSQFGADGMAEHGSNYEDILKHYYKDVTIASIREFYKKQ